MGTLNSSIAIIESVQQDTYYAMVAAVGFNRSQLFQTWVPIDFDSTKIGSGEVTVKEYRMNSSRSVVETVISDLADKPEFFQEPHSRLPNDLKKMLTKDGLSYVLQPENLERYWQMNAANFRPHTFDGTWTRSADGQVHLHVRLEAFSVVVIAIHVAN